MTKYITDKFSKFVVKTANALTTNDDLYDECTRVVQANRQCSVFEQLVNAVAYAEIAYRFRAKKFKNHENAHGSIYESYHEPYVDSMNRLGSARDRLMEYCWENCINYLAQLQ